MSLSRRELVKSLSLVGLSATSFAGLSAKAVASTSASSSSAAAYDGPIYICINADGGWDVSSFCDPKTTYNDENNQKVWVNNWAKSASIKTSSNGIAYAPFAKNDWFFSKYAQDMMVINGIDAQTNAHQAGVRHNWSGRIEDGFPAFTALVASIYGQQLPLAFLSNGGYRETAGLTTFTLMNDPSSLRAIVNTNQPQWGPKYFTQPAEMSLIDQARQQRLQRLQQKQQALAQAQTSLQAMVAAQQNQAQLAALEQHLPADLVEANSYEDGYNPMLQQVQMVLASCKAGLTVAADLSIGGFDSHSNHDMEQSDALTQLENGIDYLWSQAEQMGLAERLRVFITSDFSRTPHYNEGAGKDHWPISSAILMQKNANWRQSVVGQTDAGQHAKGLNADLSVSARADAPLLQPKHVQQLLRHWAGIAQHPTCQRFDLKANELDLAQLL